MGMVAPPQRIASTYVVVCGGYGDVTRQAGQRGVSRQRIYRESRRTLEDLEGAKLRAALSELRERLAVVEAEAASLRRRLSQAVELTPDLLRRFAVTGEARGEPGGRAGVFGGVAGGEGARRGDLGRWTKAAGAQAAALLRVLDAEAQKRVHQASADEIYVKAPVLMVVEPESLCWMTGRLSERADGEAWTREFGALARWSR